MGSYDYKCNNCGEWYCNSEFRCLHTRIDNLERLLKEILNKLKEEQPDREKE